MIKTDEYDNESQFTLINTHLPTTIATNNYISSYFYDYKIDFYWYNIYTIVGVHNNKIIYNLSLQPFIYQNIIYNQFNKECLQIYTVHLQKQYRNNGISTYIYKNIKDICLISGYNQTPQAIKTWKLLAQQSINSNYNIYILQKDVFLRDNTLIKYNGNNIDDNNIWSDRVTRTHEHTCFVLNHNIFNI
jgi:hypothetical protein